MHYCFILKICQIILQIDQVGSQDRQRYNWPLVIAKTEISMTLLAKQFFKKNVEREYYALVWGDVKDDEGQINFPIGRNPKNRLR